MQTKISTHLFLIVLICLCLCAGYVIGYFREDSGASGSGSSRDSEISKIVESTREYLVRERENLANERIIVGQERNQLESDRAEFERERSLFNKQRELVVSDSADLAELAGILEQIRILAQSKE